MKIATNKKNGMNGPTNTLNCHNTQFSKETQTFSFPWSLHSSSCLLPPASCLLPPASCLLPSSSCLLPPASCLLPPASCPLPRGSIRPPLHCTVWSREDFAPSYQDFAKSRRKSFGSLARLRINTDRPLASCTASLARRVWPLVAIVLYSSLATGGQ